MYNEISESFDINCISEPNQQIVIINNNSNDSEIIIEFPEYFSDDGLFYNSLD